MYRRLLMSVFVAFSTACSAPNIPDTLSPIEKEVFVVLVDQLGELQQPRDGAPLLLCTAYTIAGETQTRSGDALLSALRQALPPDLKAKIIDGTSCSQNRYGESIAPDGKRALRFGASRRFEERWHGLIWEAGWMCGALCGSGEIYRIELDRNQPTAVSVGYWTS